jgi:hypothetical protein
MSAPPSLSHTPILVDLNRGERETDRLDLDAALAPLLSSRRSLSLHGCSSRARTGSTEPVAPPVTGAPFLLALSRHTPSSWEACYFVEGPKPRAFPTSQAREPSPSRLGTRPTRLEVSQHWFDFCRAFAYSPIFCVYSICILVLFSHDLIFLISDRSRYVLVTHVVKCFLLIYLELVNM